ncbi:hypothetical protein WMQ67_26720 [Vibrio harveyi]|uniref:hypothetical protein n=1 Tax=Vibrio harveyi TaxID=669 RepID=UPI003751EABB
MKNYILLISTAVMFGCSTHSEFSKTGAGMMAWDNDLSAALVNNNGKTCMQMAMSMRDTSANATANVSDAILKVVDKIPDDPTPQELIKLSGELEKTSKTLRTSTERTSFLLVGSFYLCQFQANGMSEHNVKALANTLITTAGGIGSETDSGD